MHIAQPKPVSREQLYLAHDPGFVDGVLEGELSNGFGSQSPEVAASLPYTSGAMLDAARCALDNGLGAVAPCSGFHHAGYDFEGGFCTFNGLMVTAQTLLVEGRVKRLAILDLDMHYGNGTQDIIDRLGLQDKVSHYTFAPRRAEAQQWLANLASVITQLAQGCDLLLYQAGADSHVNDPLGGYLTTPQMLERDHIVFSTAKALGLPVAWNLAGGYQRTADQGIRPVLDLHDNTLRAFAQCTLGIQGIKLAA